MITETGQPKIYTAIGGGGANIEITGIDYLDSSNVISGNAVSTLGGNILIRGSGFEGSLRVIVGGDDISNSIVNTAAIFGSLDASSAGNVDLFIFEGSNVGVISPEPVRYSGAPVWTTTSFEVTDGIAANIELVASSDSTLTYSLLSGSGNLPTGLSLVSSGYISGTANGYPAGGTGQVTIIATDQEDQAAQQVVTWSVLAPGDENFYRTILSINADVETFITDASDNSFALTPVGDVRPNLQSPYWPGGWSGYFDGTGDSLVTSSSSAQFAPGTGDMTVECWVYLPVTPGTASAIAGTYYTSSSDAFWGFGVNSSRAIFLSGRFTTAISGGTVSLNTWTHISITRESGTWKAWVNGVLATTSTTALNLDGVSTMKIGIVGDFNTFTGYVSNFRFVKGTALYTENFTPPTQPLTPVDGTSLLTLRDSAFVDDSPNNFTITRNGDTRVTTFSPFNTVPYTITPDSYSVYFDGTGDYLTINDQELLPTDTSDWTVECWYYPVSTTEGTIVYLDGNTSSYAALRLIHSSPGPALLISTNGSAWAINVTAGNLGTAAPGQWHHIAVVRQSNLIKVYLNGQLTYTSGSLSTLYNGTLNHIGSIYFSGSPANQPFNGSISNLRIVKGTAVYTANFTPPTAPLTAVANTSLLTCQSTTIVDNSDNDFAITVAGNSLPLAANPFGETVDTISNYSWSADSYSASGYFDGSGDYLSVATNSAFNITSGSTDSFTCEFWVYWDTVGANMSIVDNGGLSGTSFTNWAIYLDASNRITLGWGNSASPGSSIGSLPTFAPVVGRWYHIAFTKTNTFWYLYIDGVLQTSFNGLNTAAKSSSTPLYIGYGISTSAGGTAFKGYISNLRIVKGPQVYTGPFVPPTAPLTAVTNTSLLTLQNSLSYNNSQFVDSSSYNHLITRNGNTTQGSVSPFSDTSWSGYFDGSGDYLSFTGTNILPTGTENFTVEFWFYQTKAFADSNQANYISTASTNNAFQLWINVTGGGIIRLSGYAVTVVIDYSYSTIALNTWHHFAVSRNGNNFAMFLDGNRVATATNTLSFAAPGTSYIGSGSYGGYISNMRVVRGSYIYDPASTTISVPTQPLTPVDGTSLLALTGPTLTDAGPYRVAITRNGDARVLPLGPFDPTTTTPDSYSVYFDGTGDYLTAPSDAAFAFGTGDFTIEGWFYFTGTISTYQRIWWFSTDTDNTEISSSNLRFGGSGQTTITGSALTTNKWYHIAYTRQSSSGKLFLDGTQVGSTTTNSYDSSANRSLTIFATSAGANPATGHVSNFRVIKGTALYTTNFTPPTAPLTAVEGTSLLTCQSTTIVDNSDNDFAITVAGNTVPTTLNPFGYETSLLNRAYDPDVNGGSVYFDGTGDYLTVPANSAFAFGTGNFTVEFWVYNISSTTIDRFLFNGVTGTSTTGSWSMAADTGGVRFSEVVSGEPGASSATAIPLNTWTHIAATRNGTTLRLFVNGAIVATNSSFSNNLSYAGTNLRINSNSSGSDGGGARYFSNLRILKGTAVYTGPFVPPSQPVSNIDNTSLLANFSQAGIFDATQRNNMETLGNTEIDNNIYKFPPGSMYFDGTGDALAGRPSPDFNFGNGDFTVEFWLYLSVTPSSQTWAMSFGPNGSGGISRGWGVRLHDGTTAGLSFVYQNSGTVANRFGNLPSATTWAHVAFCRDSTVMRCFVDGVQLGSTWTLPYSSIDSTVATDYYGIGGFDNTNNGYPGRYWFNGLIDDLRITKGYARYVANFTPPTEPNSDY
jgi:hypothetical protein